MEAKPLWSSLGEIDVSPFHVRDDKVDLQLLTHIEAIKTVYQFLLDCQWSKSHPCSFLGGTCEHGLKPLSHLGFQQQCSG